MALFKLYRASSIQGRMPSSSIVETFDVVENIGSHLVPCRLLAVMPRSIFSIERISIERRFYMAALTQQSSLRLMLHLMP